MNQFICLSVAEWIVARRAGLQPAAALRLEEHLAQCASCSEQARTLDRLGQLSDEGAQPIAPLSRQRAVVRALAAAAAEQRSPRQMSSSSWLVPSATGALAAVALVAIGVVLRPNLGDAPVARGRVVSGEVELAGRALAAGEIVPAEADLHTSDGAILTLAHATVELRAHTRAHWTGPARVLRLEAGSVVSEVDPKRHASFEVETKDFRAIVLGTRFEVSPARVRVERGRVRVDGRDGRTLAVLGAGQSYERPKASPPPRAAELSTRREPAAPLANAEPPPPVRSKRTPRHPQREAVQAPPVEPSRTPAAMAPEETRPLPATADERLDQARIALGRRELDHARKLVAEVLASAPQPRQHAEALTLRAECALVGGDLAAAATGYYDVAERFAGLAAAENALFAGARIDADRLRGRNAERGLVRYLARYPRGRFVKEANARLDELRGQPSAPR